MERGRSSMRGQNACQQTHGCALARTIEAQETNNFAFPKIKAQRIDRCQWPKSASQSFYMEHAHS
jgi:hypothetical protein